MAFPGDSRQGSAQLLMAVETCCVGLTHAPRAESSISAEYLAAKAIYGVFLCIATDAACEGVRCCGTCRRAIRGRLTAPAALQLELPLVADFGMPA